MMANAEYDTLTEIDDPDVAFLAGSDNLELRPGARKKSAGASSRARRPSRWCSSWIWILLLSVLVGCLVVALGVILYRRTQTELERAKFVEESQQSTTVPSEQEKELLTTTTKRPVITSTPVAEPTPPTVAPPATDLADCIYRQKRLPESVRPSLYSLNLTLLNITHGAYTGSVGITLTVTSPVSLIVLHAKNLTILDRIRLTTQSATGNEGTILLSGVHKCVGLDQLQISTQQPLQPGTVYQLEIAFTGALNDDMHGFYRSDYLDDKGQKQYLATTQFEDTHAREAFPCFDEPAMKSVFRLTLTHNTSLLALSNSPVKLKVQDQSTGVAVTSFDDTPSMSTYLAAFVLCDFGKNGTTTTLDGVEVSVYAVKHKVNQTGFALDTAVAVLKFYEDFFGIKYPLKKLDLIAIPDFSAGAMENWGLITFRESVLLYDRLESPLGQMDYVVKVVAHEIAHQWFGNLVTMTWWDQLWLNEGFATFMTYLGADAAHPELSAWERIATETVQSALVSDVLHNTHPVVMAVEDTDDIASRFDAISYGKGASVLLMLYEFLGEKVFKAGVTDYLNRHKYGNAKTDDLWSGLNDAWNASGKAGTKSVKAIAESWIAQPGFPVITTSRQAGQVSVTQNRLVPMSEEASDSTWIVPISVFDASSTNTSNYLLTGRTMSLSLSNSAVAWYKLNSGQTSYFRTNYELANWVALTAALKANLSVIPPADRANLVDDAFSLSRAGKLNMTVVLNLMSYLTKESHYLPWTSASPYLDGTESMLFETESFVPFRRWRRKLLEPLLGSLKCRDIPDQDIHQRRLCFILFEEACKVELPSCIEQARTLYTDLKAGKKVAVDMHETIYKTVVRHGDEELWNAVWERQQKTQVASEKSLLLRALASTQNVWLIDRYLRYSLDANKVRPSETVTILMMMSVNYAARPLLWRSVRQNWDLLLTRYGWDTTISSILSLLDWMIGDGDSAEVHTFFHQPGRKLGAGALALNQTLETIELRRKFLSLYSTEISDWLTSQKV